MAKTYEVTVFNTVTQKYEKVSVSKEVYHAYKRTGWNIKDNNESFYAHEIQLSSLIGGEDGAYDNFSEFIDDSQNPELLFAQQEQIEELYAAINKLCNSDRELIIAIYFEGMTERSYASKSGIPAMTVHDRKIRALKQLKDFLR